MMTPEEFKQIRRTKGLSCKKMAEFLGLKDRRTIQRYESGALQVPRFVVIILELAKREAKLVECLLVLAPHARISLNNVPAWQKGDEGIKFNKALKYVESLKELGINTNGDV